MTHQVRPEFIRLPESGERCPHTGFKRTTLYNLTVPNRRNGFRPKVPAKQLREPGSVRGVWLIPFEPLIAFINALPTPGLATDESPAARSTAGGIEAGQHRGAKASR